MNRVETTKSLAAASRGAVWLKALDPEAKLLGELIPSVAAADGEGCSLHGRTSGS